nr:MAG TPA: hypothetical protein [Caudoviricetes sp.]
MKTGCQKYPKKTLYIYEGINFHSANLENRITKISVTIKDTPAQSQSEREKTVAGNEGSPAVVGT